MQETINPTLDLLDASNNLVNQMLANPASHNLWIQLCYKGKQLISSAYNLKLNPKEIRLADLNWRLGVNAVHIIMGDCRLHY